MIRDSLSGQPIEQKIAIIYEHFTQCAKILEPESVTNEVRCLFLQGKVETPIIVRAIEDILTSQISNRDFNKFVNCCLEIIINIWLTQPASKEYIPYLVTVLSEVNPRFKSYNRNKTKLTKLICQYIKSEGYLRLKSLVEFINYDGSKNLDMEAKAASLIQRYPYLYEHYLLEDDYTLDYLENNYSDVSKKLISTIQVKNQKRFEVQLSQYIIYQIRLFQFARMRLLSKGAGKAINRVQNPTLLSDKDFKLAFKYFIGKIDGNNTLLQLSKKFANRNKIGNHYKIFKQELHQYLIHSIQVKDINYHFSTKLEAKILAIFIRSDNRELNKSLILQTCRQLISFLVMGSSDYPDFNQFADLVANLGTAQAVFLLVKIVLICPEVKSDLEKKMMIILNYYQDCKIEEVLWLIKSLEYLEIAFSIYFGKVDVSIAKGSI